MFIYQRCSNKTDMQLSAQLSYTLRAGAVASAGGVGDRPDAGPGPWVPQASPLDLLRVLDGLWQSHPLGLRKEQCYSPGLQAQHHFGGERIHRSRENAADTVSGHGDSSLRHAYVTRV